ncbi:TonB-dependent receptor [Parasegetibacter sp. NRK P23]|uniref:TonB-dependent receptor n=1 Tax=Parasegetibacter sp. NRK P23 TaxID=2942999 RepID=UPI002044129F|nr:TonB-dependent receptor [Parasegetibacter sp. NRK P23]MCM5529299.1 TonB-dependent receptor [Parasegetibacter sp. NRK P23]
MKKDDCCLRPGERRKRSKRTIAARILMLFTLLLSLESFAFYGFAQEKVSLNLSNTALKMVFREIEKQTSYRFVYNDDNIPVNRKVTIKVNELPLDNVLSRLLDNLGLSWKVQSNNLIVVAENIAATKNEAATVTGQVIGVDGKAVSFVSIQEDESASGTLADEDGKFTLRVSSLNATLVISNVGYITQRVPLNGKSNITVVLVQDNKELEQVVVVGYGTQKKATLTGAISTIDNKALIQSPVANISNSLVGRLPGLVAIQQSGEPGFDQSRIKIRGIGTLNDGSGSDPLILIDGVVRDGFNTLDPNEIESVSILKDASSTAVFGVRGANGVIMITTKTGKSGKPNISYSSNVGFQTPTQLPRLLNSFEYATLRNEAQRNMGQTPYFSQADLDHFQNGTDPYFHPDVDWFDKVLKPTSLQQQHNLNIGGGTKDTRYFVSLGYFEQNGVYNVGDLQKEYSANPKYKRYNLRSNFDFNFNSNFSGSIKLGGQVADANYPGQGAGEIFFRIMNSNPLMNPGVVDGKLISGVEGLTSSSGNPLGFIATNGYQNNFNSNLNSSLNLTHKLDFVTKGLKARALVAYDHYYSHSVRRSKAAIQYRIIKDPTDPLKPIFVREGNEAPFGFSESYGRNRKIYGEFALDYARSFGDHNFTGLALYNLEKYHQPGLEYNVPRGYLGAVGRITYNYRNKYLSEFNMGYNGSENFPEDKRFGFFPSFSLGWVVSDENFMKGAGAVSFLKIRGSYGEVGNDKIGGSRFLYLPSVYLYGGGYNFGQLGSNYQWYGGSQEGRIGNPDVTWEVAKKTNIGIEAKFFDDRLQLVADVFRERRNNILITRGTVPALVQATLPAVNMGAVENKGYEIELSWAGKANEVNYWIRSNYTFARNKILFMDEPERAFDGLRRTGRQVGQYFGLVSEGFYNTQRDLDNAIPSQWQPNLQLGDIRYKDVNGDGRITDQDEVPIGFATFPQVVYGVSFGFDWKGFDFSMLFQGATKVSTYLSEMAAWAFDTDWRSAQERHLERWTPERYAAGDPITYPRLELSPTVGKHNYRPSDFWLIDGSYLRLKNMEIAYRFRGGFIEKMGARHLRVYMNGNNLLTWSKIENYDPEAPPGRGQFYPQMRVFNAGVNIQF